MKTETNQTNLLTWFILLLAFAAFGAFLGVYYSDNKEVKPTYTQSDSIKLDSLEKRIVKADSIIKFHKENAENLILEKNGLKKSNYILSEKLKKILVNPGAKCEDKLELSLSLNDSLKLELNKCDSAYFEVDKECENYAIQLDNYKDKNELILKANKQLSDSVSKLHVLYTDSLTAQRKISDKAIKKEKSKTFFYKVTTTVAAVLGIYGIVSK